MLPACLFFFCFLVPSQSGPLVPDGQGGLVPWTNSRVMPNGTLRPYDPRIDGYPPGYGYPYPMPFGPYAQPYVTTPSIWPMPDYQPVPPVVRPPHSSRTCYDRDGNFISPPAPECAG
jgi:hypothetical protein